MFQSKMLEEIRQQPAVLQQTLAQELDAIPALRKVFAKRKPRLIVLAARGTSDNAAQFGRYLLEITTGIPVSLAAPSIYTLYEATVKLDDVLVVAISQSGESTDTNVVLERARKRGAITIGITNERNSALAKLSEHVFLVRAGQRKERGCDQDVYRAVADSLPAGVCTRCVESKWTISSGCRSGRVPHLSLEAEIAERAARYRLMEHAMVVGTRAELFERVRVCPKADGDVLRGGRALFVGGLAARPDCDARSVVSGIHVRGAGRHLAGTGEAAGKARKDESGNSVDHRQEQLCRMPEVEVQIRA